MWRQIKHSCPSVLLLHLLDGRLGALGGSAEVGRHEGLAILAVSVLLRPEDGDALEIVLFHLEQFVSSDVLVLVLESVVEQQVAGGLLDLEDRVAVVVAQLDDLEFVLGYEPVDQLLELRF